MSPWWLHSTGPEAAASLCFAFVIGHALGDFPLQSEFLAKGKDRHSAINKAPDCPPGLWMFCLGAHALTHAGIVWFISGCAWLGFAEFLLHSFIDFMKCERKIGFHLDQSLHLACKAVYAVLILRCGVT